MQAEIYLFLFALLLCLLVCLRIFLRLRKLLSELVPYIIGLYKFIGNIIIQRFAAVIGCCHSFLLCLLCQNKCILCRDSCFRLARRCGLRLLRCLLRLLLNRLGLNCFLRLRLGLWLCRGHWVRLMVDKLFKRL